MIILIIIGLVILIGFGIFLALKSEQEQKEEVLPYRLKSRFFTQSEFVFYETLIQELDKNRFRFFTKVRVADFVETTSMGKEYHAWFNKIKSKHIDFLIWDSKNNKIALGVELDGNSHQSLKVQTRDDFINKLYTQLNFPFKRIQVGSNFADEVKIIREQIQIDV
jgi:hypothetical protein